MKSGPVIFLVALAAGIALPLAVRHGAQAELDAKNETLRQQADELARLTAENSRFSNAAPAANPSTLSAEEHDELLKLRAEIGRLRGQTNELPGLREQNTRLKEQSDLVKNFQPVTVPKAAFANAGYATPEAAVQTVIWGMSTGNREAVLRGLTGNAAETLGKQLMQATDADFSATVAKFSADLTGYQIAGEYPAANGSIILLIYPQGGPDAKKTAMTVKKMDGEWKISNNSNVD